MDKKKSQEEISALITGVTLIAVIFPPFIFWATNQYAVTLEYFVSVGLLEEGDRVIFEFIDGAGIDLGRILILVGAGLLFISLILLARKFVK